MPHNNSAPGLPALQSVDRFSQYVTLLIKCLIPSSETPDKYSMKSTRATGRGRNLPDAPRIDRLKHLPYKAGKVAEIRKVVNSVVKERLAAEAAQHAVEAVQ